MVLIYLFCSEIISFWNIPIINDHKTEIHEQLDRMCHIRRHPAPYMGTTIYKDQLVFKCL